MLDTKYRGRRQGIAIREGSVRQARQEAGLTLAQVAGGHVSRTAIHLIERGRTRPSIETLLLIARRTRRPLEYFLQHPNDAAQLSQTPGELRELERLTLLREFDEVIKVGLTLLRKRWSPGDEALIRLHVGQAYCRLVRPEEALRHLPQAREYFERIGDDWMAVEALDWESSAAGLMEDPEAIHLAGEALERCRRLNPKPAQTEARILGHIANMHVIGQSWAQAVRYYQAAVEAAGDVKDLLQQAKMHHGLGSVYQRMLQPAKAREHFDKAIALYSIESDLSAVYRVENDLGFLLVQEGHLDSAEHHLRRALAGCDELRIDRRGRGYILANLGELNLRRGRLQEAGEYLAQALEAGEAVGERIVLAGTHALLGELEELRDNPRQADMHFDVAIDLLEQLGMPDRLREAHVRYADSLERRHDMSGAMHHLRRAAEIARQAAAGFTWTGRAADGAASAVRGQHQIRTAADSPAR